MAVKVHCSACDVFIKGVDGAEISKLTGKEKCVECGEKIRALYKDLDEGIDNYKKTMEKKLQQLTKKIDGLDAVYNKFISDAHSLHRTTKAELDTHLQNILVGRTTKG